ELMYLKYDPTQEEQQAINPQAFSCSTQEELILKKEDEIYFKAVKNNISYFINKNDGILKVALTSNEENAIELYSFAKENQFKILQDKASKMLKIYLKLERYSSEEILSHRGG
ncbi:DNA-directed RNA polymerase subunit beta', partial [Campylobacter jejuni]|nr:DNA-directed RNA polymerase subunit beta' [Campylobacter jejuni]